MSNIASYCYLESREWEEKITALNGLAKECALCPRNCGVNRLDNKRGFCGAPDEMVISSIFPHHGEEPPISGSNGSGTVFFSYCTLKCCFCQNYQISHEYEGRPYTNEELADAMLELQNKGCHNINLVTSTHFMHRVVSSLKIAATKGLSIPIVYNCSGYENTAVLDLLSGIIDIYLPDMKYGSNAFASKYSKAPDYVERNREAIRTMFRQTGSLKCDSDGIANRGLCIRHLVLPGAVDSSLQVLDFLQSVFDPSDISISLMSQYRPLYSAASFPEINRMITSDEYKRVKDAFVNAGFLGFYQEIEEQDKGFIIDFTKRKSEALMGGDGVDSRQ
jgi:putative pyruvate formate lyase activating enzyme